MAQQNILNTLQELQQIESFIADIQNPTKKQQAFSYLANLYKKYHALLQKDENNYTILVDMDEVLADLIPSWLSHYNRDYNHNLTAEDLTEWDTSKFTKPECGKKIYDYFKTPGLFRNLSVRPYAKEFIQNLMDNNYRVLIVSDSPAGHAYCDYANDMASVSNPADDKRRWLEEHFPMIDSKDIIFTGKKWFVQGDVIVDDKPTTFLEFQNRNRNAILIDQPYNRYITTPHRALDLRKAEEKVYEMTKGTKTFV